MADDERPWRDRETLERLYHDEGLTKAQIAEQLGTNAEAIGVWMSHYGLGPSAADEDPEPDDETLSLLREQLREDPEAIIRAYPDRARNLADRARAAGHTSLARRIDELVDELSVDA